MLQKDLAKELKISTTKLQEAMLDSGLDPFADPIAEEQANTIRALFTVPEVAALPEEVTLEVQPEKPKRGRPRKDSQLAKKAASDLENSASGASEVQATFTTSAATLRAQEMIACADVVAATGYAAFTGRLAQNDAAFLSWFANGTNQAIANNANAIDPQQILDKLGVPNSAESLGKLQAFSTNLGNVEDVAANVRFYAD